MTRPEGGGRVRWRRSRRPRSAAASGGVALAVAMTIAAGGVRGPAANAATAQAPSVEPAVRPNVVLIVVDTLRADHLTPYGWPVPTTPNLDRLLARPGVVVERAYSAAPWTIPAMVGLLGGRWPGEVLGAEVSGYAMPADSPSLAASLRALGYDTAAFVANPTLGAAAGFDRGFDTYSPPATATAGSEARWESAAAITAKASAWLARERGARPFFLYVHYVEPHDPYDSPEVVGGHSPYFPGYRGVVDGTWPQGLMLGKLRLLDPADIRHLAALYDSEVHWVDRWLGALLAGLDGPTRARTLFAFTADHGEELFDHGGWKHGRTVFDELLRVPLVVRWDGHLPAGTRVDGPVRSIDLAPTLLAAAGGTSPPQWQGTSLLPVLAGNPAPVARLVAYAQHFFPGPRRAAAVLGRWKLALFDRRAAYLPPDDYQARLARGELARLPRIALYDLLRDPHERQDLSSLRPDLVARLAGIVHDHLGREVPGVRLLLAGTTAGTAVEVELRLRRPLAAWESCFLGEGDRVEASGDRLRLTLVGEALPKGVLLPAATEIVSLRVHAPVGLPVRLGGGGGYRGGPLAAAAMANPRWPGVDTPQLLLWLPPGSAAAPATTPRGSEDEGTRRLRALGYVG